MPEKPCARSWSICSVTRAILRVPRFVRPWLARLIALAAHQARAGELRAVLGGKSPLRELTEEQGRHLETCCASASRTPSIAALSRCATGTRVG